MRLSAIRPGTEAIRRYTESGYWIETTSNEVLERNAREFPTKDALFDGRVRLNYADYYRRAWRLAAHWHRMGLTRDDVIAIQLPNWTEFAIAINAAMMLCQFHSDFRRKEVEFILRFIGASLVITPRMFRGFDHVAMLRNLQPLLDRDAEPALSEERLRALRPTGNDLARVLFTSGTTDDPKAVVHTHNTRACACGFQNRDYAIGRDSALLLFLPVGLNWGFFQYAAGDPGGLQARLHGRLSPGGRARPNRERAHHPLRHRSRRALGIAQRCELCALRPEFPQDRHHRWRLLSDRADPPVARACTRTSARVIWNGGGGRTILHLANRRS